ncbi:hypothetical protein ACES2J_17160 [Bdellovibrio bacteriovorus]|uniref:DUF6978 family protein n=1 Tax=Bdellovibrio bacteriovorus TaxID=959 RepID=UPI0035A6820A
MLKQQDADWLISLPKLKISDEIHQFVPGAKMIIFLKSEKAPSEEFILDVQGNSVKLSKMTFQKRVRKSVGLVRLDIDGPPHTNPDGTVVPCPHIHIYRESYELKWAYPVGNMPNGKAIQLQKNMFANLEQFFGFCNIVEPPLIQGGLFGL